MPGSFYMFVITGQRLATFYLMTKITDISEENVTAFPEAANAVFDIIQDQIFNQQFSSETAKELDKVFLKILLDEELNQHERLNFMLMFINLKRLLITVTKKKVPKKIKTITIDVSAYF